MFQFQNELTNEKLEEENAILAKLKVMGGPTNTSEWFTEKISDQDVIYNLVQSKKIEIEKTLREINMDTNVQKNKD